MPVFNVLLRVLWTLKTQLTAAEDGEQQVREAYSELVLEQTPPLLPTHHRTELSYSPLTAKETGKCNYICVQGEKKKSRFWWTQLATSPTITHVTPYFFTWQRLTS